MKKRPLPVTIIAWLFIAAGIVGIAYHASEINIHDPFTGDLMLALAVRLLGVIGGIYVLRGADWGRWLLIAWMAYHVCLSFFHSYSQTAAHALLLGVISYFLFRPKASSYFRREKL